MTTEAHIGQHPPHHRCNWDCQCARCGSSCDSEVCDECMGDGWVLIDSPDELEEPDDDCCIRCPDCSGHPVTWRCMSSPEYCQANPLPGREDVERGQIEWFEDTDP